MLQIERNFEYLIKLCRPTRADSGMNAALSGEERDRRVRLPDVDTIVPRSWIADRAGPNSFIKESWLKFQFDMDFWISKFSQDLIWPRV